MVLDLLSEIFTHMSSNHQASEINYLFPLCTVKTQEYVPTQWRETKALRWHSAATRNELSKEVFSQVTSAIKEKTEYAHKLQHNG